MTPLLISGIASLAGSAIDAWSNAASRRVAVEQAKFENAMNRAIGVASTPMTPATNAQALEQQLRNAPEVRGVLEAQLPSSGASLQVSGDGRVWLNVPGNMPSEITVSAETQALARALNSARAAAQPTQPSFAIPAGSLVTLSR